MNDPSNPLLRLASVLPWHELDQAFTQHYSQGLGRPAKPIRLMVGLLILKQLENLSDEAVVLQFKRNPYYQAFVVSGNSAANCLAIARLSFESSPVGRIRTVRTLVRFRLSGQVHQFCYRVSAKPMPFFELNHA
ncbi:MAG: transposase [Methylococcaceae bacterium]|nr:transposase [Methylococcaceae bacterium]